MNHALLASQEKYLIGKKNYTWIACTITISANEVRKLYCFVFCISIFPNAIFFYHLKATQATLLFDNNFKKAIFLDLSDE